MRKKLKKRIIGDPRQPDFSHEQMEKMIGENMSMKINQNSSAVPSSAEFTVDHPISSVEEANVSTLPSTQEAQMQQKSQAAEETRASKLSEGNLQATARAADLNSQLNANSTDQPKGESSTGFYDLLVSQFKDPVAPKGESSNGFYDLLISSVKDPATPKIDK